MAVDLSGMVAIVAGEERRCGGWLSSAPNHPNRWFRLFVVLVVLFLGCGKSAGPAVASAPFEEAVATYLDEHNMALAIKEVKTGPNVEGDKATMTASLTHAELGGPSVTWEFEFKKGGDGTWKAVAHRD